MSDVQSSRVVDKIYEAVESAIDSGMSVKGFREACAEAWDTLLREKQLADRETWRLS